MSEIPPPVTFIIGIGNLLRRDDGVGLVVARKLRDRLPPGTAVYECAADLTDLALWLPRCERALIVDAATGLAPGQIKRLDVLKDALPSRPSTSSHAMSLAQAVALAHALSSLPKHLALYAIGAYELGFGEGLSPALAAAADQVVAQILAELAAPQSPL